jgi:hypothetical protein
MKAIVYPIITGDDWNQTGLPIPLDRDSKSAAIRALRALGYRIMWSGGEHTVLSTTALALRNSRSDVLALMERERDLGHQLPEDAEITQYCITVWPKDN